VTPPKVPRPMPEACEMICIIS